MDRKLLVFKDYPKIERTLIGEHKENFGINHCIAMETQYVYIGNCQGIIRVFDLKT